MAEICLRQVNTNNLIKDCQIALTFDAPHTHIVSMLAKSLGGMNIDIEKFYASDEYLRVKFDSDDDVNKSYVDSSITITPNPSEKLKSLDGKYCFFVIIDDTSGLCERPSLETNMYISRVMYIEELLKA